MDHGVSFPDHFSGHSGPYKAFRPPYPEALFRHLASLVAQHRLAWDCATGNGQSALALTPYFDEVLGTDASPEQIEEATRHSRVAYALAVAERTPIADASVDLVTVSLALHWFDHDRFYREVRRVVRPGGVLACWSYHLQRVTPEVDAVVRRLYTDLLGDYWAPQIRHVADGYRSLPFPFDEIPMPPFRISERWNLERLLRCMGTWSGSQAYQRTTGRDAVDEVRNDLTAAWGDSDQVREVVWDLDFRVGRIHGFGAG